MKQSHGGNLLLLCALTIACAIPVSSIERQGDVFQIRVPTTSRVLEFSSHGWTVEEADNSRPYYFLTNREAELIVSFSFEPAKRCETSESCRDLFAADLKGGRGLPTHDWAYSQVDEIFVSEYTQYAQAGKTNFSQRHLNAHFVVDGVWIDVHLSKIHYEAAHRKLFVDFLRSLQFRQRA